MSQQHVEISRSTPSIYDERPWLGHYPAGTPADIDLPEPEGRDRRVKRAAYEPRKLRL